MSTQDLEEKGKCPYNSFREFDRKLITITSKSKIFDNYGISELENPFIGYFFVDKEEGVCVRIIGNEDNKDLIKELITENNVVINCEQFDNLEFSLYEEKIETYDLEKQMDDYYDDQETLDLRNLTEIDSLRGIYYPDDVLLTIEFEDGEDEYIWGKVDGYIAEVDKYVVYLLESSKFDFEITSEEYAICKYIKQDNKEELIVQGILERVEDE